MIGQVEDSASVVSVAFAVAVAFALAASSKKETEFLILRL
jgi:hypothetical protein